eukprot:g2222.t1
MSSKEEVSNTDAPTNDEAPEQTDNDIVQTEEEVKNDENENDNSSTGTGNSEDSQNKENSDTDVKNDLGETTDVEKVKVSEGEQQEESTGDTNGGNEAEEPIQTKKTDETSAKKEDNKEVTEIEKDDNKDDDTTKKTEEIQQKIEETKDETEEPTVSDSNDGDQNASAEKETNKNSEEIAATKIQANARRKLVAMEQEKQNTSAVKIQSSFRSKSAKKEFEKQKKAAVQIQSVIRRKSVQLDLENQEAAAIQIQSIARGRATRISAQAQQQQEQQETSQKQEEETDIQFANEDENGYVKGDAVVIAEEEEEQQAALDAPTSAANGVDGNRNVEESDSTDIAAEGRRKARERGALHQKKIAEEKAQMEEEANKKKKIIEVRQQQVAENSKKAFASEKRRKRQPADKSSSLDNAATGSLSESIPLFTAEGAPTVVNENEFVTISVGSREFKARSNLFVKFPESLLGQIFLGTHSSVKPNKQHHYLFDRNPKYFEPILEFYRDPSEVVIDPGVSVKGVERESRYFGMYDDMFSRDGRQRQREIRRQINGTAASTKSSTNERVRDRGSRKKKVNNGGVDSPSRKFQKIMNRTISSGDGRAIFHVRANERLAVVSVQGLGRLCIDVFDQAGQLRVKGGIVFDSNAAFFLRGGKMKLARAREMAYPGGFRYEFFCIGGKASGKMKDTLKVGTMDVTFKLISEFKDEDSVGVNASVEAFKSGIKPFTGTTNGVEEYPQNTNNMNPNLGGNNNGMMDSSANPMMQGTAATNNILHPETNYSNFSNVQNNNSRYQQQEQRQQYSYPIQQQQQQFNGSTMQNPNQQQSYAMQSQLQQQQQQFSHSMGQQRYNNQQFHPNQNRGGGFGTKGASRNTNATASAPWVQEFDKSSGQYYYVNPVTKESVWRLPAGEKAITRTEYQQQLQLQRQPQQQFY